MQINRWQPEYGERYRAGHAEENDHTERRVTVGRREPDAWNSRRSDCARWGQGSAGRSHGWGDLGHSGGRVLLAFRDLRPQSRHLVPQRLDVIASDRV